VQNEQKEVKNKRNGVQEKVFCMNKGSIEFFFTWRQKIAVKNVKNSSKIFIVDVITYINIFKSHSN
jgi:hypothetical protein